MSPLVLSDGWPDGPPEEVVHVEVEAAPRGGSEAVRVALAELDGWVDLMEDAAIVATDRRAWFRPAPCLSCDGSGADPSWRYRVGATLGGADDLVGPDEACESCNGSGEQSDDLEGRSYRECDQLDEGATEFWVLEVVEA